jgi:hypothetical protein
LGGGGIIFQFGHSPSHLDADPGFSEGSGGAKYVMGLLLGVRDIKAFLLRVCPSHS